MTRRLNAARRARLSRPHLMGIPLRIGIRLSEAIDPATVVVTPGQP